MITTIVNNTFVIQRVRSVVMNRSSVHRLKAGEPVLVSGKLQGTSWTDKQGQRRTRLCMLARLGKRLALVPQEVHP